MLRVEFFFFGSEGLELVRTHPIFGVLNRLSRSWRQCCGLRLPYIVCTKCCCHWSIWLSSYRKKKKKKGQAMPRNRCHWVVGRWTMTAPSLSNDPYLTVGIWKEDLFSKSPTFICYIIFFIMEKQTLPFLLTLILDRPHIVFNVTLFFN